VNTFKLEVIAEPGKPTIVSHRKFAAPRSLVFDVWTKPEHMKNWWGPRDLTLVVCEIDLRVGGKYRFVHRAPDGQEFGFYGEYREVVRPERLVSTFIFEPMPEHVALETVTFEEQDGITTVSSVMLNSSVEARDGHLASGMEEGMIETYDRLDELLASLMLFGNRYHPSTGKTTLFTIHRNVAELRIEIHREILSHKQAWNQHMYSDLKSLYMQCLVSAKKRLEPCYTGCKSMTTGNEGTCIANSGLISMASSNVWT
jgi:uncharacterized protein YndB with AHSA1/START domain